jgi:hypothetical protein
VVVSRAELARVARGQSLLMALQSTRPTWLAGRSARLSVSVDGAPPTDVAVLGAIAASDVVEMRLLRGAAGAAARITPDGDKVVGDVILVRTRTQ